MNYITTQIPLPEEDYKRLKTEAAKQRKSFVAIVQEKLGVKDAPHDMRDADKILADIRKIAKKNAKYTKGFDLVKALREIRYQES